MFQQGDGGRGILRRQFHCGNLTQTLSALQIIGVLLVIGSIWLGQRSNRTPRARIACRKSP
ncbi:hypothetical protein GBV94_16525 [Klebsiella pneumoniae]|nr:hypothetical protein GBV94_16525 [Klebsiella pneumoniae]